MAYRLCGRLRYHEVTILVVMLSYFLSGPFLPDGTD